jgi:hypothetical protein
MQIDDLRDYEPVHVASKLIYLSDPSSEVVEALHVLLEAVVAPFQATPGDYFLAMSSEDREMAIDTYWGGGSNLHPLDTFLFEIAPHVLLAAAPHTDDVCAVDPDTAARRLMSTEGPVRQRLDATWSTFTSHIFANLTDELPTRGAPRDLYELVAAIELMLSEDAIQLVTTHESCTTGGFLLACIDCILLSATEEKQSDT